MKFHNRRPGLMLVWAIAALATLFAFGACADTPEPRDLDAYICGDAEKDEDARETDPDVIAEADCIEVYDETDADDDEVGTLVGRYQPVS